MQLVKLLFSAYSQAITSLFFMSVVLIAYLHIQQNAQLEASWLGILRSPVHTQIMDSLLYGLIVGLLASAIILLLGIGVDYRAMIIIWPVALLLMLFNQRYLCFSYASGIVSIISLLFNWPRVDVSALMALVGVLHLMEALLILMNGHQGNLPVYVEHRQFQPVGAYLMRKLWPIPLVVLVLPDQWMEMATGGIGMPDWWPIFQPQTGVGTLMLFPIVAALGYGDIAITQTPRQRTRDSGFWLSVYSLIILIMAIMSSRIYWMKYLVAICAPLLHELLIIYSKKGQVKGKPAFEAPWRGLRVLEVFPELIGHEMGLKQGDIILRIKGQDINSEAMLGEILQDYPSFIWIEVKRGKHIIELEYKDYKDGIHDLGVMFVPRQTGRYFLLEEGNGMLLKAWREIKEKIKSSSK